MLAVESQKSSENNYIAGFVANHFPANPDLLCVGRMWILYASFSFITEKVKTFGDMRFSQVMKQMDSCNVKGVEVCREMLEQNVLGLALWRIKAKKNSTNVQ